jgi:hypothetical protein
MSEMRKHFLAQFGLEFVLSNPMLRVTQLDVEAAKEDLRLRTLEPIGYDFGRLIYLSSLRDFNTGEYYHQGLAHSFSEQAASAALAACHQEIFYRLTSSPLESLVAQVERFIRSSPHDWEKTFNAWETLEAYRVMIPSVSNRLVAELFRSNVKVAMEVLKCRGGIQAETQPAASPLPLLGQ